MLISIELTIAKPTFVMVLLKVEKDPNTELEDFVIKALEKSMKDELKGIECPICDKSTCVSLQIRKHKLNGISIQVEACCDSFKSRIETILLQEEHLG